MQGADLNRPHRTTGGSSGIPSIAPLALDEEKAGAPDPTFAEIDCLRGLLPGAVIDAAEKRAAAVGTGADRVLIASGALSEETYLRALAASLAMTFEPLVARDRAVCPVGDDRLIEAVAVGLLPLRLDGELFLVVAPRGTAARRIVGMVRANPTLARRFRFTTAERLRRFVFGHGEKTIGQRAAHEFNATWPALSAAPPRLRANFAPLALAGIFVLAATLIIPVTAARIFELTLAILFIAWIVLRLAGAFISRPTSQARRFLRDDELPVYTIISALYHEATSVAGLLASLERLDYPIEKIDVKLVIERDDEETRAAIAAYHGGLSVEVIVAPGIGPRTKPKALNVALPFARGTFTVVFDAEDRPEPNQLRRALHAFWTAGDDLACVQARLSIDNTADGWLAAFYTAEYAGQFDVFLPGIAALQLPVPLGGSSNHFRTATLRAVGGWDSYNVTEDADLGMRLARFGYRAAMIDSTTFEEAPTRFVPWLKQRTRWFKGWVQTWMVHMRAPRRLLSDLGPVNFVSFQLVVGGNVLAALVHPLFLAGLIYAVLRGAPMWKGESAEATVLAWLYGGTAVIGYLTSIVLGCLGLARRGLLSTTWVLLLTPVHWLLLSLAAWRALYQIVVEPYRWEKTEHGLAITSRRAAKAARSLSLLERYLSGFETPAFGPGPVRYSPPA
ncbi:MAG TPA: glycosyltransferase family 2 protein [Pseudolabrys sp.]|nr:glycosyltransferase family 2 protein [Pseudolabrys sp.]